MLDRLHHALRLRGTLPALLGSTRTGAPRVLARCGEIAELADTFAASLYQRHGLRPGDTVGIAVRPGPRALAVMLACNRLGVRAAVLDPAAGPDVLRARLALARPALIIADATAQAAAGWAKPLARRADIDLPRLDELGPVATVGPRHLWCAPSLKRASVAPPDPFVGDGDAVVIFTSGTTAAPRAVVHTRSSLTAGMRSVAELVAPKPETIVLGGTFFVLVPALAAGATVALPARRPVALNRQIAKLQPAETYLTPPQARRVDAFTGRVWTGSAPAGAELLSRIRQAGAAEAWSVYALTELFPAAAIEAAEKAEFTGDGDLAGHLLPGVIAKLDGDELVLTGPQARDRYLGEAPDPWVRTGDRAHIDGAGRIVLAGRTKDMVLRGAENIYPGLYEPSLHLPGVELAVLVGVPAGPSDPDDERLVALVQPRPGADPGRLRRALEAPFARMGGARPDAVVFADIPLAGRSRKPDRVAAAQLCMRELREIRGSRELRELRVR